MKDHLHVDYGHSHSIGSHHHGVTYSATDKDEGDGKSYDHWTYDGNGSGGTLYRIHVDTSTSSASGNP